MVNTQKFLEKEIRIPTRDGHIVYGTLNDLPKKSENLIIFVHGLAGHKNEHQFYNAARFFARHGFATYRFDLYSGEKKGRSLTECSIKQHSRDLNRVIQYFMNRYRNLFLVGHSLGGPTILSANLNDVVAIALWDPTLRYSSLRDDVHYNSSLKKYVLSWGTEYLISREMFREWSTLDNHKLIQCITRPTKIICAGKGILWKSWKRYEPRIAAAHQFVILHGAGHCFDEGDTERKLFEETLAWFQRYK